MPYKSAAQEKFMHAVHPDIGKQQDAKARKQGASRVAKVYNTGTPVAHKNMKLDRTGYINREVNKGKRIQPSTGLSGVARMGLKRAAQRRLRVKATAPRVRKGA